MVFFCGKNVDIQLPGFNQEEWCFNQRDCWYGDIKQDDIMGYPVGICLDKLGLEQH